MIMMHRNTSPGAVKFRIARFATTLTLCGIATASIAPSTAQAVPTETNQNAPGLADTPGSKSSITSIDRSLTEGSFKLQDGLALLNSSLLLKVYYYAYSGTPVDYSEILTENTENIVTPKPVQASDAQKQAIDRFIQMAKTHPDVLIKVDDIALDPYDKANQSYQIVNRLFINGTKYYFDNSPYHYFYADAETFRKLQCTDAKTRTIINSAITNYEHFSMNIVGHVSEVVVKDKALTISLRKLTLKNAVGEVLITHAKTPGTF
jgi:hypothetical protein